MDGLFVKDKHTAVSCVTYLEDGEREETPLYGSEHYLRLEATPEEFEPFVKDAKGVYIFKDTNAAYWQKTLALKKKYGFCLEWEINASAATGENCEMVQKIASQCDIFSLNKREAFALLDVDQLDQAIEILSKWPGSSDLPSCWTGRSNRDFQQSGSANSERAGNHRSRSDRRREQLDKRFSIWMVSK